MDDNKDIKNTLKEFQNNEITKNTKFYKYYN